MSTIDTGLTLIRSAAGRVSAANGRLGTSQNPASPAPRLPRVWTTAFGASVVPLVKTMRACWARRSRYAPSALLDPRGASALLDRRGPGGIRVVNVFPGPLDEESNRALPPPKLGHNALASAVVAALRDGIEDVYPGDVAQDIVTRFRESQKVLERELWDQ